MRNYFYFLIFFVSLHLGNSSVWADPLASRFVLPQLKYEGGNFKPLNGALEGLLMQIARRTSIEILREPIELDLTHPALHRYPFLYMAGNAKFEPLPEPDIKTLRHFLNYGGFLLIDDNSQEANSDFDESVRRLVDRLFPQTPLKQLSRDHSIYRSFYLINHVTGRTAHKPFLEEISVKGRTVLVYSSNDLGGAWARNKLGGWNYDMLAGGEVERQESIRLGINIAMYALTLDYKKDMVHLPIILERLRRYRLQ